MSVNDKMENYEVLEALFTTYEQQMYRICYRILGNSHQSEDAVADAFERLVRYLPDCAGVTDFKTRALVVKITQSAALDIYRRNKREAGIIPLEDYIHVEAPHNPVDEYLELMNCRELLDTIMDGLPELYAGVIRMRFFYGLDIGDIAKRLSISEDNVYQRIARARRLIKNQIGDEIYERKENR